MNYLKGILILFISISLTGCFGLFDGGSERIIGDYILIWIDLPENQRIIKEFDDSGSGESVVPAYIYSVGHNEDFIIAKQHPTSGFESGYKINDKITNYYIIDVKHKILKSDKNIFGPLSKEVFDNMRKDLNIDNIDFDMNYPEEY